MILEVTARGLWSGFRVVAAGLQFAKDHTNPISPEASKKLGAKIRGQAVSYCRRHQDEFVNFFCDNVIKKILLRQMTS